MEQDISNENRGNASWKNRLEDPAILGEITGSETNVLWEKLHDRLRNKPLRKRFVAWYWVAAACLLVVLLLPFINNNFTGNETKKTTAVKQPPIAETAPQDATVPAVVPIEDRKITVEKSPIVKVLKQAKSATVELDNVVPEAAVTSIPQAAQNDIQLLQNNGTTISSTPIVVAAAQPVLKQKLKVVHINELGYPEETTQREEHIADYRSIRFNPVSPQTYTTTSTAQNPSDLNFLKIKNTPSN